MEALLDSIKQVAAAADEAMRSQLIASLNQLTVSLETPDDTLLRYGGMVSFQERVFFTLSSHRLMRLRSQWNEQLFGLATTSVCSSS